MTAITGILERPWAPLVVLPLASLAIVVAFIVAPHIFPPAGETRTVVKVCLNGTLVLRTPDGDFRVMRPNAWGTWPAIGPEVCQ